MLRESFGGGEEGLKNAKNMELTKNKMTKENLKQAQNVEFEQTLQASKNKLEGVKREVINEKLQNREKKVEKMEDKVELTPQQKEIVRQLNSAKSAQQRVDLFARFADDYGLDVVVGLFPGVGDGASSLVAGLYLLFEAKNIGLSRFSMMKIVALQAADFFVGAIPVVGDAADYLFKANKWSANSFKKNVNKLVEEARKNGIPEDQIDKLVNSEGKVYKALDSVVGKAINMKKMSA